MHTTQRRVGVIAGLIGAMLLTGGPARAQQHDPYHSTLYFGTGLITIPVAWVSPNSADAWVSATAKRLPYYGDADAGFATSVNTNFAIDTHWWGRASVGVSAYSQNPEWGFFGQVLALRDNEFFTGLPSVAIGVRNIGKYKKEDRFMVGHDICLRAGVYEECSNTFYDNFKTNATIYGVATKEFALGTLTGAMPATMLSFTLGWGNGLFSDDGDQGDAYNEKGTLASGLFLGGRGTFHPSLNTTVSVLAENDGWDYNAGVIFDWRGLSFGIFGTELEEGGREEGAGGVYNYTKFNASLGYSGNIIDISRGVILRTRITALTREMQRLRTEITLRERRIAGLEVALRRAQAGELANIEQRRREIETQVQQERDAIREAQRRLEELERGRTPPPTTPPSNPPTSSLSAPTGSTPASN